MNKKQLAIVLKMANDERVKHWSNGYPYVLSLPAGNPLREGLLGRLRRWVPDLVDEFIKAMDDAQAIGGWR